MKNSPQMGAVFVFPWDASERADFAVIPRRRPGEPIEVTSRLGRHWRKQEKHYADI